MSGPGLIVVNIPSSSTSIAAPDPSHPPLQNGVAYAVQVQAVDTANNTGPCSNVAQGTPETIDDFWRLYTKDGGGDPGGCSHAGGGLTLLALLGVGLLLAKARGKGRA
jgi:hypothetical protein